MSAVAAEALLGQLEQRGVRLCLEDNVLRYRAGRGVLTVGDKQSLQLLKGDVMELVRTRIAERGAMVDDTTADEIWEPADTQMGMLMSDIGAVECVMHWACKLDVRALTAALEALTQRQSVLRVRYRRDAAGRVWAITQPRIDVPLRVIDARGFAPELQRSTLQRAIVAVSDCRLDPVSGPLLQASVVQLGDEDLLLLFAVHHSIFDAASQGIFARELRALYEEQLTGVPANLPPLPLQYSDFARQQRAWLAADASRPHLEYWRARVADLDEFFYLPYDRRSDPGDPRHVRRITGEVSDPAEIAALQQLAKQERTTMFVLSVSIFHMLLARWSGRNETFSWVTHVARPSSQLMGLIGCFAGYWLLRADLPAQPSFLEVMRKVQAAYEDALPHVGVPLQKVAPELARVSKEPLKPCFSINYLAIDRAAVGSRASTLAQDSRPAESYGGLAQSSPIGLDVRIIDSGSSLRWTIAYSSFLFEERTIERAMGAIVLGLGAVARNPHVRQSEMPIPRIASE